MGNKAYSIDPSVEWFVSASTSETYSQDAGSTVHAPASTLRKSPPTPKPSLSVNRHSMYPLQAAILDRTNDLGKSDALRATAPAASRKSVKQPKGSLPSGPGTVKDHLCPWEGCDQWFAGNHNVQQHIREQHTMERPYACEICAALGKMKGRFARPFGLYRHTLMVHGIKMAPVSAKGKGKRKRASDVKQAHKRPNMSSTEQTSVVADGELRDHLFEYQADAQSLRRGTPGLAATTTMGNVHTTWSNDEGDTRLCLSTAATDSSTHTAPTQQPPVTNGVPSTTAVSDSQRATSFDLDAPVTCAQCMLVCPSYLGVLTHGHYAHDMPSTPYCGCNTCQQMHSGGLNQITRPDTSIGQAREEPDGSNLSPSYPGTVDANKAWAARDQTNANMYYVDDAPFTTEAPEAAPQQSESDVLGSRGDGSTHSNTRDDAMAVFADLDLMDTSCAFEHVGA